MAKIQMTAGEYNQLEKQLEELITVKRVDVIERLKVARSYGDLSENSEYDSAKDEQAFVEAQITDIEQKLRDAEIIAIDDDFTMVSIGKKVTVQESDTGNIVDYHIVGVTNVDIFKNKISKECPVGKALAERMVDEEVVIETPKGNDNYKLKILAIAKSEI